LHNFKIFFIVNYLIAKPIWSQIIKELTPRDTRDIERFESVVGIGFTAIERYQSGEWEWYKLWDYNFDKAKPLVGKCACKFEALRFSGRRKGYPLSIMDLKQLGFSFILVEGEDSLYVDSFYECSCGQKWKEEFVEAMQYCGNHAWPISDGQFNSRI